MICNQSANDFTNFSHLNIHKVISKRSAIHPYYLIFPILLFNIDRFPNDPTMKIYRTMDGTSGEKDQCFRNLAVASSGMIWLIVMTCMILANEWENGGSENGPDPIRLLAPIGSQEFDFAVTYYSSRWPEWKSQKIQRRRFTAECMWQTSGDFFKHSCRTVGPGKDFGFAKIPPGMSLSQS